MSEEVTTVEETEAQADASAVKDTSAVVQAFAELDPSTASVALKKIANALDVDGSSVEALLGELAGLELTEEIRGLIREGLKSIGAEYEAAKNTKELEKTRMADLQDEWLRAMALAAEDISAANAHRETQVRNVLAVLNNANEGRTEEQRALQLEVYNMDVDALVKNEEAWASFESMLETRQLNSLQPDVGFNICVLPYEIGDPDAADRATVENAANFVRKLASLGERLNIVFFLDVHTAGRDELKANPVAATKTGDQHDLLTSTLEFMSWDPKDGGRLGQKLSTLFNGNDVSRYVVLNGGVGLLASRKLDEDLEENDAQHGVLLSPSAVSAGLTAWSVAGEGPPVIAGGSSPGTGGIVGVEATACVALKEHQELARRAGVNSVFIPELSAVGAVDTSSTLARADPKFNNELGQTSVEAILLSQYINRMAAQLVRRLSQNEANARNKEIVEPLRKELELLKTKGILRKYDVEDKDITDELATTENAIAIEISFQEVGKLDSAMIKVSRATGSGGDEGKG